jgi:hypothetical protein
MELRFRLPIVDEEIRGIALLAAPLAAEAQRAAKVPRTGYVRAETPPVGDIEAFRQGP